MTEDKARRILGRKVHPEDSTLYDLSDYVCWPAAARRIILDGEFTAEELEAMAWWIRNKTPGGQS